MNDDQRKYLQENVNSLVFDDDDKVVIDDYKCISCKQLAITHNVANCKHIFCSHCIRDVFYKTCPVCQDVIVTTVGRDDQFENKLLNLRVKCNSHGCNEMIPLRNLQNHEKNCECSIKELLPKLYRGPDVQSQTFNLEDEVHQLKAAVNEIFVTLKTMNQHLENIAKSNQTSQVESETKNTKPHLKKTTNSEGIISWILRAFTVNMSIFKTTDKTMAVQNKNMKTGKDDEMSSPTTMESQGPRA